MSAPLDLPTEIAALASALGLTRQGSLNPGFFQNPLTSVESILSNPDQRSGLLAALDQVLPPGDDTFTTADGQTVSRHPIVQTEIGVVSLETTTSGSLVSPDLVVALYARAEHADSQIRIEVDLPIVRASGTALQVAAGALTTPMAVTVTVPVGWDRATHVVGLDSVSLSALVIAPPNLDHSRVALRLAGLDVGVGGPTDLVFDPMALGPDFSHALVMLAVAGLKQSVGAADDAVTRLIEHLPTAVGLDGELPALPLGRLISDAGAFQAWLASLTTTTTTTADGGPALLHWLDGVTQMLGLPAIPALPTLPTPAAPLVVPLTSGGASDPALGLRIWLDSANASAIQALHVALDLHLSGAVATLAGRAELLVVPLAGNDPVACLPSAEVVVESNGPLLTAAGPLTVGIARGGLRWDGTAIVPVLELDDVHVDLTGVVEHPTDFARLDLTHAKTLAAEAKQAVGDFISAALGSGDLAESLLGVLGFSAPPTAAELGAFANDPIRAIGVFHRQALDAGTYGVIAQSIARLFGGETTPAAAGTAADPWSIPLSGAVIPAGSSLGLSLSLWDVPSASGHELHLGLAVGTPAVTTRPGWAIELVADLVSFRLPTGGTAQLGVLGTTSLAVDIALPELSGVPTRADQLTLRANWQPGAPLAVAAQIVGLVVSVDGTDVSLGPLALPGGFSEATIDAAWPAVRELLGRAAGAWGGPAGTLLSGLLGLSSSPSFPAGWPLLALPGDHVQGLLGDPLEAVRARLAALALGAEDEIDVVLDRVRDLLCGALPSRADLPAIPAAPPIGGTGTYEDPWRIPLTDAGTPLVAEPTTLLSWLEPAPPKSWSAYAATLLADEQPDLAAAVDGLRGLLPTVAAGIAGTDPDSLARWLTTTAAYLDGTDGLAATDIAALVPTGVQVADPVTAAHHLAPAAAAAVAATTKHLQDNGAAAMPTLLLAPSFTPADVWAGMLTGVATDQQVRIDLRVPGIDPAVVDLSGVGSASHYLVDLADDGQASLTDLVTRLHRIVTAVLAVTGAAKVAVVGHSAAGLAGLSYAAAHPTLCQACVTIAAPYASPAATLFAGADEASGIRLVKALFTDGFPGAPALGAAVDHLAHALDGFVGLAPTPYPVKAFARVLPTTLDVSAVPTLAIAAGLDQPLTLAVSVALIEAYRSAPETAPTHLAWGLRADLDIGADDPSGADPQVTLQARLDLGRVAIADNPPTPTHPAHRLLIDATVSQPGGWLVGSAGTGAPLDVRLRAAGLRFESTDTASTFTTTLYDGAVNGSGLPALTLQDPRAARLMDALVGRLAAAAAGSASRAVVDLLAALDVVTVDPASQVAATRKDAVDALENDAGGWLGPRMTAVLDSRSALVGLTPDPVVSGQPRTWRRPLGALPVELAVAAQPWSVGIRTTGAGIALADDAAVELTARLPLGGSPTVEAGIVAAGVTVTYRGGTVGLSAPPLLDALQVFPASAQTPQQLLAALSTTGVAAAASAVLTDLLGGALPIGSMVGLVTEPGRWLADARRFGDAQGRLDPASVAALLTTLGGALGVPSDASGLHITDTMTLAATTDGGTGLRLRLTADQLALVADGPTLDLDLRLDVSGDGTAGWTVVPGAAAGLTVPLDGGTWPSLTVGVELAGTGVSLTATPGGQSPIELWPTFPGLWDLLGGGLKALLPGVLDQLVTDLSSADQEGVLARAVAVADALGLRSGTPPLFDSQALAGFVDKIKSGDVIPPPAALVDLATAVLPAASPITPTVVGSTVQVTMTSLPVPGTAQLSLDFPGSPKPPTIAVRVDGLDLGPATVTVALQESDGDLGFAVQVAVDLEATVGFTFAPTLSVSAAPLTISLLPLGPGSELDLELRLAPDPGIHPDRSALGGLLSAWAEPIVAKAALEAGRTLLNEPIWTPPSGDPLTAMTLLRAAALVTQNDAEVQPVFPLPATSDVLRGLLTGLTNFRLPISPDLSVAVYAEGPTWLGLGLLGEITIDAGDFQVSALFGSPEVTAWTDPAPGLGLLLLDDSGTLFARPGLRLGGVGVEVAKKSGRLVDTDIVRIGTVRALVQAAIDLAGGTLTLSQLHGGVELTDIGLPLGGSGDMSNPVANSLLKPSGAPGDDQPASPPASLQVYSDDSGRLTVRINDKAAEQPFFIDIHKTFGPLHIDRIGLQHLLMGTVDGIGALVDGGVNIAGLSVDVQGLELAIPLQHPAELNLWTVDLAGLSLAFSAGPVSIAGGLLKTNGPAGVEYDGELKIDVGSFGLTALGAYAQAKEGDATYTSLFVFVVVNAPLGGPPFLFVTGLAGGAGYNRQLIVPSDPALIPNYPLVRAMDGPVGGTDSSPMATLRSMSAAMPARRGSYWVAAGVKFTTFELLNTKALAYVALDRGFEVGLMGVMTMALPTPETAVVSVELALGARYSSADQLLAIRAQLTNNSWLISKDCQLTGGFAFYSWFGDRPQVLFTIGGMGPHWFVEPGDPHQYPVVPPVGFHWSVFDAVVVKGETYFALTPRQLAFGGRLEVTGDFGPVRVWFAAWLDVDIEWDPLKYHADIGISIGASFHFTIDLLFTSITISVSISLGGSVVVDGPPLHGTVTVDLEIASVSVDFGSFSPPDPPNWAMFAAKFLALTGGPDPDPTHTGVDTSNATVTYGQLADSGKAPTPDQQPNGSFAQPWPVLPEFGVQVISKLPLSSTVLAGRVTPGPADPRPGDLQTSDFSIKPLGSSAPTYRAHLELHIAVQQAPNVWVDVDVSNVELAPTYGHYPLAVWLVGGQTPPPAHPDMWLTPSGATLGFPVTILERTGALGEASSIPISTLVEESSIVKPLPFSTPAHRLASRFVSPESAPAARSARPARCVAVLPATGSAASSTHRMGVGAYQTLVSLSDQHARAADGGEFGFVDVRSGETHVWRVPSTTGEFRGRGSGRTRVVTLSPTGYVLDDREGLAEDMRFDLHPHAERIVVAGSGAPSEESVAGWQLGSTLTQVGPDTALGLRCAVLLPIKAAPPEPAMTERRIAARDLLRGQPGVQTVLPADVDAIIVLLDDREPTQTAGPDDLVVSVGNGYDGQGAIGAPAEVVSGDRRCLVYPVTERPEGDRLDVVVASARGWQVAGVVGVAGETAQWVERLRESPHADLVRPPAGGESAQYVVSAREVAPEEVVA